MPYLPLAALPGTLWRKGRYYVARHLQSVYVKELTARNLFFAASTPNKEKKVYGGASLEATNDHFAYRFCASVMRLQNALLDTQGKFGDVPKDIIQTFSSHRVSMLDIPCGTGAGGLGLISVIHELRLAGLVPTLPLDIDILAGDVSPYALEIYRSQMNDLAAVVKSAGIGITLTTIVWDAFDLASSNKLCSVWENAAFQGVEGFVLVTNFSGAGDKMFPQLQESFRHISVRVSHKNDTLLWVEPGGPSGKSFLSKVLKSIGSLFGHAHAETQEPPCSEAKWWHDLHNCEHPVKTAIQQYERRQ